ncbi:hypothetical protein BK138_32825 [Paenibacillus rhizosphaerae]|uniref:Transposase-like Mu C-terminal domain-containing protein n=1 Tax=Paenibacillus rhizosphaerae TaxID=297318 RepID=A0A1R1E4Z4_9BACL|nr:Mu transposase C-terminal domain-containing protein [Paenibacillus rhizosphaerae]OMF46880.1 hypothetical protein BK138_32825 [Paenibacillus rhizosphaerae]
MGYPHIIFDDDREHYEIDFLYTDKKPYTRDGVRWDNRIYKSDECQDIIGTGKKKYTVKYDIDDIGSIYLLHPKREKFIKLFCASPPMGKSLEISVSTPYSEQKAMSDKKAKEEIDIEEQLLNEALEAEQNNKRMRS